MKKPTPAQLAARARFAEMVRSGAFKKKAKKAAPKRKSNPASKFSVGDEVKFAPAVVKRAEGDARVKNMRGVIIEIMSAGKTALVDTRGTFVSEEGNSVRGVPTANLVHDIKRNPAKRKKTVSQKISQLMHEGYPQKQAVAVALSEQRAGKVKRNPNALLKPILRLDGWEVSRYKSMDTAVAEARRRAVSDFEHDKPNPKTHYVTKAGRTMYEVTTQPYGDSIVMQVKPADALKLYELGYTSRDFHEQLRTKRKTNPATGRKASRTKLNPINGKFRYVLVVDDGGFTYGMDDRTPVQFVFSNRDRKQGVYRSFLLPDSVTGNPAFQDWARALPGQSIVTSLSDLRKMLRAYT